MFVLQRQMGLGHILFFLQLLGASVAYWAWAFILQAYYGTVDRSFDPSDYSIYFLLLLAGLLFHELRVPSHRFLLISGGLYECHRAAGRLTVTVTLAIVAYLVATKDTHISRFFLVSYLSLLYLGSLWSYRFLPGILARSLFAGLRNNPTLLFGPVDKAGRLAGWIDRKGIIGINTVGMVTDEQINPGPLPYPVLGNSADLEKLIQQRRVSHLILVEFPFSRGVLRNIVEICERQGTRLLIVNDLDETIGRPITNFIDDGWQFLSLRTEPLESPLNRMAKRTLDIAVAIPALVFLLPLATLIVWLAQRLQSPGPLLYKQVRAGISNNEFTIYKFRTMHVNHGKDEQQATRHDSRIYPLGYFFRKFSIDELPQFWNVLRGEMSVVGPRPHLVEHNDRFSEIMSNYHVRSLVKPGITGLAQISGLRGEASDNLALIKRVECDIHYLENWSLLLDLRIILQTAGHVVMPPKTAY